MQETKVEFWKFDVKNEVWVLKTIVEIWQLNVKTNAESWKSNVKTNIECWKQKCGLLGTFVENWK